MLLGDLGADVVKVEPPGGDPVAPAARPSGAASPIPSARSAGWPTTPPSAASPSTSSGRAGRELFLRALRARRRRDSRPSRPAPRRARPRLGRAARPQSAARPLLAHTLRADGPAARAARLRSDRARDERQPLVHRRPRPARRCAARFPVSHYHGGIEAAVGVVFALLAREHSGQGQHVDVALHEAMVMPNIGTASMCGMTGNRGKRAGAFFRQTKSVQREIWPCQDGHVSFALRGGPARIPGLVAIVKYMDEHGMASPALTAMDWKTYNHNLLSQDEVDALSAEFERLLPHQDHGRAVRSRVRRATSCWRPSTRHARSEPRSSSRRASFFVDVPDPGRGRAPRARARSPARRRPTRRRPRSPCDDPLRAWASTPPRCWPRSASTPPSWTAPPRGGGVTALFDGTTILEFGGGAAGPVATRYFADHGATRRSASSRSSDPTSSAS